MPSIQSWLYTSLIFKRFNFIIFNFFEMYFFQISCSIYLIIRKPWKSIGPIRVCCMSALSRHLVQPCLKLMRARITATNDIERVCVEKRTEQDFRTDMKVVYAFSMDFASYFCVSVSYFLWVLQFRIHDIFRKRNAFLIEVCFLILRYFEYNSNYSECSSFLLSDLDNSILCLKIY